MTGFLVVNGFLQSEKFTDLYGLLEAAFRAEGMTLALRPGTAFAFPLDAPFDPRPDFVLFWDKDVALARRFERSGIPVFNSAAAVAACDSKAETALALAAAGVPAPRTILAPKTFEGIGYAPADFLRQAGEALGYPYVLKEAFGSFGRQVYLVRDLAEAERLVSRLGYKDFIMQAFVSSSFGRDVRINVVGGKACAAMLRTSRNDFRSNVTLGGEGRAFAPSEEWVRAAVAAAAAVGADFAGVDVLFGPAGAPLVCEVNSNPHFRSTLEATGVNLAEHIAALIVRIKQV